MLGGMSSDETLAADPAEVRRLGPDDWKLLRDIRLTALAEAPHAFGSTLAREQAFSEAKWRSRLAETTYFAAWQHGEPAGIAAGLDDGSDPGRPHLVSMWVSPQARGRGVADAVVAAVIGWARDRGAAALLLWVTDANSRARAFYQRMGFRSTGLRQLVRPDEPDHWEEQMARELS
jgi:GNAT superfamily N-acetyltransferase